MSSPKDQQIYGLAGGLLKRSGGGVHRKCSVTAEYIENLGEHAEDAAAPAAVQEAGEVDWVDDDKNFTWSNIVRRYKKQSEKHASLNLYKWVAFHWI